MLEINKATRKNIVSGHLEYLYSKVLVKGLLIPTYIAQKDLQKSNHMLR